MIYFFDVTGTCIRASNFNNEDIALREQYIVHELALCGGEIALSDDGDYPISNVYTNGRIVIQYTAEEQSVRNNLRPGFIWKMPERVAIDQRNLSKAREEKLRLLAANCDAVLNPLKAGYPSGEQQSWDKQESEARSVAAGAGTPTPLLSALAQARGITLQDLASRIITKADAFAAYSGAVIGNRQRCEDAVAAATTIAAVDAVTWS